MKQQEAQKPEKSNQSERGKFDGKDKTDSHSDGQDKKNKHSDGMDKNNRLFFPETLTLFITLFYKNNFTMYSRYLLT